MTGTTGVAYLALAGPLSDLFDLPIGFLRGIGAFLAVFAIGVWLAARRPRPWGRRILAVNVPWVLASFGLVLFELNEPSTAGTLWTAVQAIVVAFFVALRSLACATDSRPDSDREEQP